jgi:Lipopolysaccharide-assembly
VTDLPDVCRGRPLVLLLALSGCGYSLNAGVGRMPPGAQHVFVRPLENRTTDAEAGVLVAAALRQELARRGAEAGSGATARIEGAVDDASFSALGLNPPVYRLALTVTARLLVDGKVLAEQRAGRVEDWLSGLDPLESEGRRRLALRRAAEAVAKDLIERFEQP